LRGAAASSLSLSIIDRTALACWPSGAWALDFPAKQWLAEFGDLKFQI
jgi:hypothetical protein